MTDKDKDRVEEVRETIDRLIRDVKFAVIQYTDGGDMYGIILEKHGIELRNQILSLKKDDRPMLSILSENQDFSIDIARDWSSVRQQFEGMKQLGFRRVIIEEE